MAKRPYSFTFTFSFKNQDIRQLLEEKKEEAKENNTNFIVTDYMCEAVRFYEKYKDSIDSTLVTESDVINIVNKILLNKNLSLKTNETISNVIETSIALDDVDDIPDDDIEED